MAAIPRTNSTSSTKPGITAPPHTIQPTPRSLRSTSAGLRSRLRRIATTYSAITPVNTTADRMIMNHVMYDTLRAESLAREKIDSGASQPAIASNAAVGVSSTARRRVGARRVARSARRIRLIGRPQGFDVRHDLPDVAFGQLRPPRRHPVLPPLRDRGEDR